MSKPTAPMSVYPFVLALVFALHGACAGPETATRVRTDDVADPSNRQLKEGGGADSDRVPRGDVGGDPVPAPVGAVTAPGAVPDDRGTAESPRAPTPGWELTVDTFAAELVAATEGARGAIALFPTFGMSSASNDFRGCEFGDRVAERIGMRLQAAGRRVMKGAELQRRIQDTNRGLDLMVDVASAQALAERVAQVGMVDAIVTGVAELGRRQNLGGARQVKLRLDAAAPFSGQTLANARLTLSARDADEVAAEIESPGAWKIGAAAPRFVPSTDRELTVVAAAMLAELVDRAPDMFDGKRVIVQPLVVGGDKAGSQRVQQFARSFMRALRVTEEKLASQGVTDTYAAALQGDFAKPFEFEGKSYKSVLDALARYDALRAEVDASSTGRVAQNFATDVGEIVRALSGDRAKLVNASGRDGAVAQIQADALAYADDGSIDPATIAMQRSSAAEFMLTATLDRGLDQQYVMRVALVDLTNANHSAHSRVTLEPWMTERLAPVFKS